jgi:hypothetical protein
VATLLEHRLALVGETKAQKKKEVKPKLLGFVSHIVLVPPLKEMDNL